ncbi:MAG: ligand-binding sensor domain-containing protein, partial [Flavipsychrobacter sp.]
MSGFRFYRLLLLLLAVCTFHASNAQRYPFYNLNVENGLIQSQAKSIVQDRFGHLWIGTIGGLSRYDGKTFVNYTVRDGMTDNTVDALAVDDKGNIWIGTPKGITQYDGRSFRHFVFQSPENPNANAVSSIKSDADKIWCIAGNRLYTIANGKSNAFKIPGSTDSVTTLLPEKNGLWIANTRGTIYHHTGKKWDSLAFNEPQLKGTPYISAIFRDSRQRIWLATSRG